MSKHKEIIKEEYAKALENAKSKGSSCCSSEDTTDQENSCCSSKLSLTPNVQIVIPSFGSTTNLAGKANLKTGDVVVDFGSGPGHDLIQAAKIIGKSGKAIGIDFTPEMVENATNLAKKIGLDNVVVYQGDIENVPLESNIADVIISNCVINLTNDKLAVFKEAFRILKSGGRLFESDVIAGQVFPESLKENKEALCGCIAGALTKEGYIELIKKAGFIDINIHIEQSFGKQFQWQDKEYSTYSGIITAKKP